MKRECPSRGKSSRSSSRGSYRSDSSRSRGSQGSGRNKSPRRASDSRGRSPRRSFSRSPRRFDRSDSRSDSRSRPQKRFVSKDKYKKPSEYRSGPRYSGRSSSFRNSRNIDRQKLLDRQKSGRCIGCGSKQHHIANCPKRKVEIRPPTPKYSSRPKSGRVSVVDNDPLSFGREGNVEHEPEAIVDLYMASLISMDPMAILGVDSDTADSE